MFTVSKNILINLKSRPNYVAKCNFLINSVNLMTFLRDVPSSRFTTLTCNMASKRRVKSICFADYDVIGFDCDHTLAQYNLYNLFKDTYETMAEYLVTKKGYNKEMFKFNPSFCSRGVVLDLETGNFMKLAHDGRILRAFHGTKLLPKREYEFQIWPHHEELSKTMTNIGTRYRIFENFFDMASSLLCAQIIDHLDEKYEGRPDSYDVWPEVVPAIKYVYIPDPYKASSSMFFMRWIKETRQYLEEGSTKLKEWLARMKMDGRPMFILSSAYEDFAEATLKFVLGDDWGKYFDFSVFLAEKPRFFYENNPFYHLSSSCEQIIANDLKNCKFIYGGNLKQLQEHLSFLTGKADPKVLYFGDSQRSDIIPSKVYAGWDTVMVLEEMACETCFYENRVNNLKIEACQFEDPSIMPWGSVLIDASETKSGDSKNTGKIQTMVHSVARKYSDIAVPNLQFLLDYPIDHKFQTFDPDDDCSLSGFHPFIPHSLRQ